MNNPMQILGMINQLKKMYADPKKAVEDMLSSGQITQEQLDNAIEQSKQFTNLARVNF